MKTSLREELNRIVKHAQDLKGLSDGEEKGLSLGGLLDYLGAQSPALLALILALPFLLPMPLPGVSTPFGIVIMLLGFAIMMQRAPWLPERLRRVEIPEKILTTLVEKLDPWLRRFEKLIKPRFTKLTDGRWSVSVHGVLIVISAALLTLPAPPGGNVGPGISIICYCLAIIEKDGVLTMIGLASLAATIFFFVGVFKLAAGFFAFAHQAASLVG